MTAAPPATLDPTLSHTRGETDTAAARDDHRRQLRRHGRAVRRARGPRRRRPGPSVDVCRAAGRRRPARSRPAGHRRRDGRPGRHLGAELLRVDARAVRDRQDRRHPRQHQPELPVARAAVRPRTRPASRRLVAAESFKSSNYRRDGRGGARRGRRPRARRLHRHVRLGRAGRPCRRGVARASCAAYRRADEHRPDQHPVHLGHHGIPQGRDAEPPQHPQQRLLRRRALRLHRGRPGLHPRALLPLLRHGHGQPRVHDARRLHGHPGARLRPGRDPAGHPGREGHLALRRADDVHRRVEPARLRRLRPVDRAHRHHGRIPLSRRADEEAHRGRHRGDDDLLRHDRDVAGVDAEPHRRHASSRRSARSAASGRTSRSRSSTRDRRDAFRGARPASS